MGVLAIKFVAGMLISSRGELIAKGRIVMAAEAVTGDRYRAIDRKMREIKRQLDQEEGYPFDLDELDTHLQLAVEGRFANSKVSDGRCTLEQAAEIFGTDFHTLAQAEETFGRRLNDEQKAVYQGLSCPMEVVQALKGRCVLTPTLELDLVQTHAPRSGDFWRGQRSNPWFGQSSQAFSRRTAQAGYHFVGKGVLEDSVNVQWGRQTAMVKPPLFVPGTAMAAQAALLHYRIWGEKLFRDYWARTSDQSALGLRVYVGFNSNGFNVDRWIAEAYDGIGVAWARKFA